MSAPTSTRELARRWPWSLAPWEKDVLYRRVRVWMADRRANGDIDADIGEWLGRSTADAHAIASEAGPS